MKAFKDLRNTAASSKEDVISSDKIKDLNIKLVSNGNKFDLYMNNIKFDSFTSKSEAKRNYKELLSIYSKDIK